MRRVICGNRINRSVGKAFSQRQNVLLRTQRRVDLEVRIVTAGELVGEPLVRRRPVRVEVAQDAQGIIDGLAVKHGHNAPEMLQRMLREVRQLWDAGRDDGPYVPQIPAGPVPADSATGGES